MNIFDEYVMIAPGSDYGLAMWADLKKIPNCTFYDYVLNTKSRLLNLLHHIHFSFALNKRFNMPLQGVWNGALSLKPHDLDPNKRYCIIFTDISACRVGKSFLNSLSKLKNVTLVLVLVNVMKTKKKLVDERLKYFSCCFSFDKRDCEQYGFIYHPTFYSVVRKQNKECLETDAFFVGVSKGSRYGKLLDLMKAMEREGLKHEFYISHVKNIDSQQTGLHQNTWLDYGSVLDKVMKTHCLVEIMGGDQDGLTLRAMEAICYNKLLLTDNPSVKELPYYETGYIHYEKEIEKADLSFLKQDIVVDYHYQGDFSPFHLVSHINEVVQSK